MKYSSSFIVVALVLVSIGLLSSKGNATITDTYSTPGELVVTNVPYGIWVKVGDNAMWQNRSRTGLQSTRFQVDTDTDVRVLTGRSPQAINDVINSESKGCKFGEACAKGETCESCKQCQSCVLNSRGMSCKRCDKCTACKTQKQPLCTRHDQVKCAFTYVPSLLTAQSKVEFDWAREFGSLEPETLRLVNGTGKKITLVRYEGPGADTGSSTTSTDPVPPEPEEGALEIVDSTNPQQSFTVAVAPADGKVSAPGQQEPTQLLRISGSNKALTSLTHRCKLAGKIVVSYPTADGSDTTVDIEGVSIPLELGSGTVEAGRSTLFANLKAADLLALINGNPTLLQIVQEAAPALPPANSQQKRDIKITVNFKGARTLSFDNGLLGDSERLTHSLEKTDTLTFSFTVERASTP